MSYAAPADIYLTAEKKPTFDKTDNMLLICGAVTSDENAKALGLDTLDYNAHLKAQSEPKPTSSTDGSKKSSNQPKG